MAGRLLSRHVARETARHPGARRRATAAARHGAHAVVLGFVAIALATGSAPAAAVHLPQVPPLPPLPPAPSDAITVEATLSLVPMGGILNTTGTFTMSGSCAATVSDGDPSPEVYVSPTAGVPPIGSVCTVTGSGAYSTSDCLDSSFDGTGSLSGVDGNLTGMSYHLDVYSGIGLFSGTATESEVENGVTETYPVVLYGAFAIAAVPSVAPGNNCLEGVSSTTIAGAVSVVESTSSAGAT